MALALKNAIFKYNIFKNYVFMFLAKEKLILWKFPKSLVSVEASQSVSIFQQLGWNWKI